MYNDVFLNEYLLKKILKQIQIQWHSMKYQVDSYIVNTHDWRTGIVK